MPDNNIPKSPNLKISTPPVLWPPRASPNSILAEWIRETADELVRITELRYNEIARGMFLRRDIASLEVVRNVEGLNQDIADANQRNNEVQRDLSYEDQRLSQIGTDHTGLKTAIEETRRKIAQRKAELKGSMMRGALIVAASAVAAYVLPVIFRAVSKG